MIDISREPRCVRIDFDPVMLKTHAKHIQKNTDHDEDIEFLIGCYIEERILQGQTRESDS